jgi:hypothetical protein
MKICPLRVEFGPRCEIHSGSMAVDVLRVLNFSRRHDYQVRFACRCFPRNPPHAPVAHTLTRPPIYQALAWIRCRSSVQSILPLGSRNVVRMPLDSMNGLKGCDQQEIWSEGSVTTFDGAPASEWVVVRPSQGRGDQVRG